MTRTLPILLVSVAGILGSVNAAHAQTALGDGRGLERDSRQGGGGNTARSDFGAEVRLRNAIVTGNAPGGKSFRGNVGYRDPGDFGGRLGSDSLYAYRRDSIYSGLAGMGYRGTEALQYQFSQTTGNANTVPGSMSLSRFGGGTPFVTQGADKTNVGASTSVAGGFGTPAWANVTGRAGTLRSTSSYTSNRGLTPVAIGFRAGENGQSDTLASSSLLGVKVLIDKPVIPGTPAPLVTPGIPREQPKSTTPITSPLSARPLVTEKVNDRAGTDKAANPLAAQPVRTAFDDYRDRLNRYGELMKPKDAKDGKGDKANDKTGDKPTDDSKDKPENPDKTGDKPSTPDADKPATPDMDPALKDMPEWERRMIEMRRALLPESKPKAKDPFKAARNEDGTLDPAKVRAIRAAEEARRTADQRKRLDKDTIDLIKKAADEKTKMYISSAGAGQSRDIFTEHVREAQKLMADERYMDAEERFSRALAAKPGDAACMGGRVNSQVGGGLYVAASANLKATLIAHPEMTGMRYESYLLPSPERMQDIAVQLRKNITSDDPIASRVPRESALILAYIGHQLGDKKMITEGLRAFAADVPEADVPFLELVESVWSVDEAPAKPETKPGAKPDKK
jgi:hypothetical protein